MPIKTKPLSRSDVPCAPFEGAGLPAHVVASRWKLPQWADLLFSGKANTSEAQEILPDILTDFFCDLLGHTHPADDGPHDTISGEKHVRVEGDFADTVPADFGRRPDKFIVALDGNGPRDRVDRPCASRRMSAVDQGCRCTFWVGRVDRFATAESGVSMASEIRSVMMRDRAMLPVNRFLQ